MKSRSIVMSSLMGLALLVSPLSSNVAEAKASTISVKLANYIGNTSQVNFKTTGDYKLANSNVRLDGDDRFEVANNVASSGWKKSNTVIVVNYLAFADALAATPLAYKYDAPILLTRPDKLTLETRAKINELDAEEIIIVGGTASVSKNVENELKAMSSNVGRIGGKDRYEVSQLIARNIGNPNEAIVANGLAFADSLSIAPYAAVNQIPILLTRNNDLPSQTKAALKGIDKALVIGGEGSVSRKVYDQLPPASRIGGKDRFEVSANIVRQLNLNAESAFISTGLTFADALTGSVLAAKQKSPLLLTRPERLPEDVAAVIKEEKTTTFTILGGKASVSEAVVNSLPNELALSAGANYLVKADRGRIQLYKGSQKVKDFGNSSFTVVPASYNTKNRIKINSNVEYLGKMQFTLENGVNIRPINRDIPYEDYLKGVIPHEMPASWNLEALKAQTVAARTYSIDDMGGTVVDTQSYQVYGGYNWHENSSRAVDETEGKVLKSNGKLISAVFSASNGGYTESNANAWNSTQLPYLVAKKDSFDTAYKWEYSIKKNQLGSQDLSHPANWWWSVDEADHSKLNGIKSWIKENGLPNSDIKVVSVNSITIDPEKNSSGRSLTGSIEIDYYLRDLANATNATKGFVVEDGELKRFTREISMSMENLRKLLGTMEVKSTLVKNVTDDKDSIIVNGSGFGHGVGMSQYGANSRAEAGQNYKEILSFYYPGTQLVDY